MNKATTRELAKAVATAQAFPAYAAATLATLIRSAPTKSVAAELLVFVDALYLRGHMEVVNGVFVAKAAS